MLRRLLGPKRPASESQPLAAPSESVCLQGLLWFEGGEAGSSRRLSLRVEMGRPGGKRRPPLDPSFLPSGESLRALLLTAQVLRERELGSFLEICQLSSGSAWIQARMSSASLLMEGCSSFLISLPTSDRSHPQLYLRITREPGNILAWAQSRGRGGLGGGSGVGHF